MGRGRFVRLVFLSILLVPTLSSSSGSDREALEIGIGVGVGIGGGAAPSTPQPECPPPRQPQPSDFENILQYRAYFVIQRFKQTITCDPKNKTGSWTGFRICNNDGRGYQGFYCETPPGLINMRTIASVDFNGFTLSAPTVCGFVDQLPDLALFHANSNSFGGTVPALATLPFFYELDVSNNRLSGGFPASVFPLVD
ncbi:leucine Rich Repeat, partial [Musa troglodytarum]